MTLLDQAAERGYVGLLLPHAAVLKPNLLEALILVAATIGTLQEQREAAR